MVIQGGFIMTFNPADILIPKTDDMTLWSVVACDQYTSEPEYWDEVEKITSGKPSAYHIVLPELYLEMDGVDERIRKINETMLSYCNSDLFKEYKSSYIYIERTQKNGKVRKGIIGAVDLEDYDYNKGSETKIRATEGTVSERIPPRLKVRMDAKLELPHIMLLIDDAKKQIIERIGENTASFEKIYDFEMMMDSGSIKGWLIDKKWSEYLESELEKLEDISDFNKKYDVSKNNPLVFAVGDGNHSLATAKEYYNKMKENGMADENSPARYALCELVNLHDDSLVFEAIHRVVFDIDTDNFVSELEKVCAVCDDKDGQVFTVVTSSGDKTLKVNNPSANLTVGSVQNLIDSYISKFGGRVDYIHGEDVVRQLSSDKTSCGILLDAMDKNDLYKTVVLDGALPRKTFSMGDACDKRFYNEARIINPGL